MAGVGFSLRSIRAEDSYIDLLRLYGAAGIISSGPWLISIFTLLLIGILGQQLVPDSAMVVRFQVSITWLFAASLVLTGPLLLTFTRYLADRHYLGDEASTIPNLFGVLALSTGLAALVALGLAPLFSQQSFALRVLLGTGLVTLCSSWFVVVVLGGLREHVQVLGCFALGYGVIFGSTLLLARYGETGLLAGFVIGQGVLLFRGIAVIIQRLPANDWVAFGFLDRRKIHWELLLVGLFYNLGIWADKLLFWFDANTSRAVIGPLRASEVYDLPIFLAYLTTIPAMAVFLMRVETDFAQQHRTFYASISQGAPLGRIEQNRDAMTAAARCAIADIVKVEGLTLILCYAAGPQLLQAFGISLLHLPLFQIDAVGVGLQVLLLATTSIFFYLDRRRTVIGLTLMLLVTNLTLTWLSQRLGPEYYGYGYAVAVFITALFSLVILNRALRRLVRDTFMLQPVSP